MDTLIPILVFAFIVMIAIIVSRSRWRGSRRDSTSGFPFFDGSDSRSSDNSQSHHHGHSHHHTDSGGHHGGFDGGGHGGFGGGHH